MFSILQGGVVDQHSGVSLIFKALKTFTTNFNSNTSLVEIELPKFYIWNGSWIRHFMALMIYFGFSTFYIKWKSLIQL